MIRFQNQIFYTKIIIYKSFLRPVRVYANQIRESVKPSQIRTLQIFQSITLQIISFAPWFVSNSTLRSDLKIKPVNQLALQNIIKKYL